MLDLAIKLARNLEENKYKIACVITDKRGRIISTGQNSYSKSHPRQAYYAKKMGNCKQIFLHSEIDAIIKSNGKGHAIYIARVNNKGNVLPVQPCPICAYAIKDVKIKKVYTT